MVGLLSVLLLLAFFIILIILLGKFTVLQQSTESIRTIVSQMREQLFSLEARFKDFQNDQQPREAAPAKEMPPVAASIETITAPEPITEDPKPVIVESPAVPEPLPTPGPEVVPEPIPVAATMEEIKKSIAFIEEKTSNRQTDWEKFIGENLANKIGIAILVLGISFFVKFAIDKHWINEAGRVIIGLISGGILVGLAHYIRDKYRSFSSVLVGGGLSVFYFTIAFAFHEYHLISQSAAFLIMVVITAMAVALSLFYDRMELAILAITGGFITPFLVSTGQNNYVALFTYLTILNAGLLVLLWFKRWKPVNIIALFFTIVIYGGWLIGQSFDRSEPFPSGWAFFFGTIFYLLAVSTAIINNLRLQVKFGAFDFILLLGINFLYYIAGIVILEDVQSGAYKGLFTATLGIFNLLLAGIFFATKKTDRNFVLLLIGLTITYISLAGPVQLKGNHITLFWAAEVLLLFWLYQRTRMTLLKIASVILLVPMVVSLLTNWSQVYMLNDEIIPVMINKGFITTVAVAAVLLAYRRLMKKETAALFLPGVQSKIARGLLLLGGTILLYASGAWEINHQFATRLPRTDIYSLYIQLYSFLFIAAILFIFKRLSFYTGLKFILTGLAMILYVFNLGTTYEASSQLLRGVDHSAHFIAHWAGAIVLLGLIYQLITWFRRQPLLVKEFSSTFTWLASGCVVFLLSMEMYYAIVWTTPVDTDAPHYWENLYYKAGLSILWGICSFAMMWLGMKYKFKPLRIVSLTLFSITLVKLFIYDIRRIPPGGKIAAFILLGVLLLIVSFMYQRLKRILMDDGQAAS